MDFSFVYVIKLLYRCLCLQCTLQGITVEFICDTLRQFPVLQDLSHDQDIYILCEVQSGHPDTLEVLIVSATLNITYMFCPSWYLHIFWSTILRMKAFLNPVAVKLIDRVLLCLYEHILH